MPFDFATEGFTFTLNPNIIELSFKQQVKNRDENGIDTVVFCSESYRAFQKTCIVLRACEVLNACKSIAWFCSVWCELNHTVQMVYPCDRLLLVLVPFCKIDLIMSKCVGKRNSINAHLMKVCVAIINKLQLSELERKILKCFSSNIHPIKKCCQHISFDIPWLERDYQ